MSASSASSRDPFATGLSAHRWTGCHTAGTLFPKSSEGRSGDQRGVGQPAAGRLANLSGFDGSPESMRGLQLEYGAEIGRAIVSFDGPIVIRRHLALYHGVPSSSSPGAQPADDRARDRGSFASVIGGAPRRRWCSAAMSTRGRRRTRGWSRSRRALRRRGGDCAALAAELAELRRSVRAESSARSRQVRHGPRHPPRRAGGVGRRGVIAAATRSPDHRHRRGLTPLPPSANGVRRRPPGPRAQTRRPCRDPPTASVPRGLGCVAVTAFPWTSARRHTLIMGAPPPATARLGVPAAPGGQDWSSTSTARGRCSRRPAGRHPRQSPAMGPCATHGVLVRGLPAFFATGLWLKSRRRVRYLPRCGPGGPGLGRARPGDLAPRSRPDPVGAGVHPPLAVGLVACAPG